MDEQKQDLKRQAASGDPDAVAKVKMARCRSNECCAHSNAPTNTPTGCAACPFRGWRANDEIYICNLSVEITIPEDADGDVLDAVPAECPLWKGAVLVNLKQLAALR